MTLDPQAEAFIAQLASRPAPAPEELSIEQYRAGGRALAQLGLERVDLPEVRDTLVEVPGGEDVRIRVYRPSDEDGLPIVVWVHGGTWVRGDLETHDPMLRYVAERSGCVIVGVDQRLAPEAPHPAPLTDVYEVACWTQGHAPELGGDPERIAIAGDSSGGGLAAAAAIRARDEGGVRFALQVLIVPALDLTMTSPSWDEFDGKFLIGRGQTTWAIGQYAPGADLTDPLLSPLLANDVAGLPPALVFTAEYDPLRDDGELYVAKLDKAGVDARLVRFDGLIHHAILVSRAIPAARRALERIADDVGSALRGGPRRFGED